MANNIYRVVDNDRAMIFTLSMMGNSINGDDEDDDPIILPS